MGPNGPDSKEEIKFQRVVKMKYGIIILLSIFFIYMVIWTLKFHFFAKRQAKVKRIQELRAKSNEAKNQPVDNNRNYWYNQRELTTCENPEETHKFYHYFDSVEEGMKDLLLEMYDCGIVRTDELEQISYGKNRFENMDMSFLNELDNETKIPAEESSSGDTVALDDIIQVDGVSDGFFAVPKADIVTAAKELKEDDPGIMDIKGTLSEGVEQVLAAVEAEKEEENKKNEPILVKEEKSVEEAKVARELTSNAEVRGKVYEKWTGYVKELFSLVVIHADDEMKKKIEKSLLDYGYNDVDVLLECPD